MGIIITKCKACDKRINSVMCRCWKTHEPKYIICEDCVEYYEAEKAKIIAECCELEEMKAQACHERNLSENKADKLIQALKSARVFAVRVQGFALNNGRGFLLRDCRKNIALINSALNEGENKNDN